MKTLAGILAFGLIIIFLNPGMSHKVEITLRARNEGGYEIFAEKSLFFETSIFRQERISYLFPARLGRPLFTTPSVVSSVDVLEIQTLTDGARISIINDDKSGLILPTHDKKGRVSLPSVQIDIPLVSRLDFNISLNVCGTMCSIEQLSGEVTLEVEKQFRLMSIFNLRGV
jgi:hypothetical protein